MDSETLAPYEPRGLQRVEGCTPLIEEASLPNKELWLVRIPSHELDVKDLANTQWNLKVNSSTGSMGHIVHKGIKCSLKKHEINGCVKYAYLPAEKGIHVRPLVKDVILFRSADQTAEPAAEAADPAAVAGDSQAAAENQEALTDQEVSGVTKESSKRSGKSSSKSSSKHKRQRSEDGGGTVSEAETVEMSKKKSKGKEIAK